MEQTETKGLYFRERLMRWHEEANDRALPWKQERDPYLIWLSEVILQQTRAQQALPYYERLKAQFATVTELAQAADEAVFRSWQGLGYYSRCRNMLATARYVAEQLGGAFPNTYEGLIALKGIGPYTAAAIASFAYGLPHAVLDGNVYRVLARYFAIETPQDSGNGNKYFGALAQELLDTAHSAAYNQAIMDLGATVCLPAKPLCTACPLSAQCVAYARGTMQLFPVKSRKVAVKTRYFHYLLMEWEGKIWVQPRVQKDIWRGLNELYLVESDGPMDGKELAAHSQFKNLHILYSGINQVFESKQRLTHQVIDARFYQVALLAAPEMPVDAGKWVRKEDLKNVAFPKTVVSFLEKFIILLE